MAYYLLIALLTGTCVSLGLYCLRLRHTLDAALIDQTYGIFTRVGGEWAWRRLRRRYHHFEVVFLDLDNLHHLNLELGYAEVDRRIRGALVYREDDIMIARWYSGDEIVAVVPKGDGEGFAHRLLASLRQHQLSATFGVVPALPELTATVQAAMQLVNTAKAQGERGCVRYGRAPSSSRLEKSFCARPRLPAPSKV